MYGNHPYYAASEDEKQVLAFVKENHDNPTIAGLKAVYGELLEFEPAEVIQSFRIKNLD